MLSWCYIERPILAFKELFRYRPASVAFAEGPHIILIRPDVPCLPPSRPVASLASIDCPEMQAVPTKGSMAYPLLDRCR